MKKKAFVFICVFTLGLFTCISKYEMWNGIQLRDNNYKEDELIHIQSPAFSKESGFYEDPFYLSIESEEGMKIFYTLDGSEPTEESIFYDGAIYIDNATEKNNYYSLRTDVSTGFLKELIDERKTYDKVPGYVVPDYNVEKCNIIRAIAVSDKGQKSEIESKVYFVGSEKNTCNTMCLVTDPSNLFDREKGIYVTGEKFERAKNTNELWEYWRWWDANYRQAGKEWERESEVFFFNKEKLELEKEVGIRIQGNASRADIPKSLNFYARKEYDGQKTFENDFFKNGYSASKLTLTAGSSANLTQFNDYMIADKTKNLYFSTMSYIPYELYLNGEYWGFYWLTDKYDENYLAYQYGVDPENVIIIKEGDVAVGKESYRELYVKMRNTIINSDMTKQENYDEAGNMIDIDSFIDYYATKIYIACNEDWPSSNFALWRTLQVSSQSFSDGKWRWMMYDCNGGTEMSEEMIEHDTLSYVIENDELFASLWKNEEFKKQFEERILYIADTSFNEIEMKNYIDEYCQEMHTLLEKSWKRFYGKNNNKENEFYEKMQSHKQFFVNRKETVELWF